MLKAKTYDVADSNIANLGSDLEKNVKKASAEGEQAWKGAGQKVGMEIWRIEKFKVVAWPKDQYGSFYDGDSYICLNTYKKPDGDALLWDVHFWLGTHTTQDEAGTAAYKTVELDTLLDDGPVQHREVQGHESDLFMSYFKGGIKLLSGGVDSGFNKVKPEEYKPRLLHVKGTRKTMRVNQVESVFSSMNSGDVFILDCGLNLYQWNGSKSGPFEKQKGAQLCRSIDDERKGKPEVHVIEEGGNLPDEFTKIVTGSPSDVKSAEEGGDDKAPAATKKMFQLSDATGKMEMKEVKFDKSSMVSDDVMIIDVGSEVFVWVGKGASKDEKAKGLGFAQTYLKDSNKPAWIPISRYLEGRETNVLNSFF